MVFGTTVCEIWTQVGGIQNYRRNQSVNIDYGCLSVSTIGSCDQYTAWLAINEDNSPIILVYSPQGLKRISSDGIDHLLDNIHVPSDSTALFYTQDGHLFYQLTFFNPKDNLTLVYDFNTEKFFNLSDQDGNHHPARKMVYFDGSPYFISLNNASLYLSDTRITIYNENLHLSISYTQTKSMRFLGLGFARLFVSQIQDVSLSTPLSLLWLKVMMRMLHH